MKFDIIIQGGQSNADGSGIGSVTSAYIPTEKVYYLETVKTVEHTPERVVVTFADEPFRLSVAQERVENGETISDFALSFAEKYIADGRLAEDRKLLIVRAAVGGTGFKKGDWGIDAVLYEKLVEMVSYALSLDEGNRVVAFL